ncbi:carbohydrate binding family 9 domain-containing protein [Paucibacter sp. TC2R-5]|uniref:carbohydrate binding family 9 domain-containing protein n=1 Tax=Paucibacter sp. TC2R-5 TaxID=2893555 RepID=UPI0021E3F06E|nr:carbohydrate binding family 9 domain-containing protein [Paucibacter sp. TC2R-5]MCV2360796.1 carbohydrate binding family 9 domain-containing protein [Paucibacter sp. TC2R-5]
MKNFILGVALAALGLSAQASSGIAALRLTAAEPVTQIDGRLDEAAWQRAPLFDQFVQFLPQDKQPARWRTTVQVLLSDDALVFGIRAYDPAPELIRAPLSRRDKVKRDQDFVSVVLDPVGQRRSAQFARVSAAGVIADGLFSADDDAEDFAPDFDLQAAVQLLPDGYSVELRWPLAALRFPYADGAPWLLMVTRSTPRESSRLDVSAPLSKDSLSFIAELQPLGGLGDLVEEVRERSFLNIRPELTARRERASDPSGRHDHGSLSLGAELKWRPRADWVIDATLNPDFSQVELDTPQLAGNTRFALSVQEKRSFFLESTDVVGQSQSEGDHEQQSLAAFYSRAITDPNWGLRATWRGAMAEATLLSLQDAGGGEIRRANAYGTQSYAQSLASRASFARTRLQLAAGAQTVGLGLLASQRDYGQGASNAVLGSDFSAPVGDTDLLRGHLLASSTSAGFDANGQLTRIKSESGHKLWTEWRRRNSDWNNSAQYEQSSPRFANDNGFVSQTGFRRVTAHLNRRLPEQTLALPALGDWAAFEAHELELQLKLMQSQTLDDAQRSVKAGEVIERQVQPGFWLAAARNTGVWGHLGLDQQRARAGGTLHAPRTLNLGFESNPTSWLTLLGADLSWGRQLDVEADRLGRGLSLMLQAKLRSPLPWGAWLELEQQLGQSHVRNPLGQRSFTENNAQTLAVLHISAFDSFRAIAQQTRYQRAPEAGLLGSDERSRHVSLVYQHRMGLSRILSLGLVSAHDRPAQERHTELFAKATFGFQP